MEPSTSKDERLSRFELKTVLETSRMLIESRKSDFVLNNLLLILMGKLLSGKAAILLVDPNSKKYTVEKERGLKKFKEGDTLELNLTKLQNKSSHFYCRDFPDELRFLSDNLENCVFFNLRTSNRHLGFLFLGPKANQQPYAKHELEFAESLCIISSVAITNSQLFDELKNTNRKLDSRIHELNTLFDLSKEFNLLVDREKISRIFKFALLGQLFVRKFFLIYKNGITATLLSSNGINSVPKQEEMNNLFDSIQTDVTIVDDTLQNSHPFLQKNDITTLIGIAVQSKKTAVIGVGRRVNNEPFTETDFNFLKSLSNLAVVSIQKTYFLEERIDKERMEEELSIAKSIQQGLMPDPIPKVENIDLAAKTISSREIGGDYFDVAGTPDGNTIFAIGDVTGKGVPAALLMANLQSMLHVLLPVDISLSEATERINNLIHKNTPSDKFITFFWAKYLKKKKILSYVNAGHNPPLLLRSGQQDFEELSNGGLLLGAMETMTPYQQTDIKLEKNDLLVSYTDGVNEALDESGKEEYGTQRLMECIKKNREKSSSEILEAIMDDVRTFSGFKLQDDLTLLIIKASG
ncbi:MAG: PP2C family protein-serine/threonine phosphatase [Balneolaceae bacterium]